MTTEWYQVKIWVQQGSILSPILLNIVANVATECTQSGFVNEIMHIMTKKLLMTDGNTEKSLGN